MRRPGGVPRARPCRLLSALALVLALGAACRPEAPADDVPVQMSLSIAPTPPIVGPARLVITLTGEDDEPVEGAQVRVEGTMAHAGMTPVHEEAEDAGEGRYAVPEFGFTMAGDWILFVRIELPDGREAVREREVRVAGAEGAP